MRVLTRQVMRLSWRLTKIYQFEQFNKRSNRLVCDHAWQAEKELILVKDATFNITGAILEENYTF